MSWEVLAHRLADAHPKVLIVLGLLSVVTSDTVTRIKTFFTFTLEYIFLIKRVSLFDITEFLYIDFLCIVFIMASAPE